MVRSFTQLRGTGFEHFGVEPFRAYSPRDGEYSQSGSQRCEEGSLWRMEGCKKQEKVKEEERSWDWLMVVVQYS